MIFIVYAVICFFLAFRELNKGTAVFGRMIIGRSPILFFVIYLLWGVVSMFWSVDYKLTGFRAFECFAMLLLFITIIQRLFTRNPKMVIDWTILYVTTDILFSLLRLIRYTTDITALLQTSQMMSTTFFFIALYYFPKRWYHYLVLTMSIFSLSTVAYIGMAIGSVSVFFYDTKYKVFIFLTGIVVVTVIAVIGPYTVLKNTVFIGKKTISMQETSGRDKLMNISIESLKERALGAGFFAGEPEILYSNNLGAISAHNSIFSAMIGLGYFGLIIMSLFFMGMARITFSSYIPSEYRAMIIGCFCVGFMHCMGNPGIGSRVFGSWMPVTYLFTMISGFYVYNKYFKTVDDEK